MTEKESNNDWTAIPVVILAILMFAFMVWILYTGMMGNMRLHPERGWFQ